MKTLTSLADNKALLSTILDVSIDAIIAVGPDRKIILFNGAAGRMFGYESGEVIGRPLDALLPGDLAGARVTRTEVPARRKDGTTFPAEVRIAQAEQDGQAVQVLVLRDLTVEARMVEALRLSEERYRHTLDNMLEGCQIIGFDWRYLYLNDVAAEQGRQSKDALVGRTMMDAYPGIEKTDMFAALRRCMEERKPHRMVNDFTYPDGSTACFELSIQPIPAGIFILSSDITSFQEARESIRTQLTRLAALRAIDIAITGNLDSRVSLNVVLEQTTEQLGMDAAAILLLNPHTQMLRYAAGRGFRNRAIEHSHVRVGEGLSGKAMLERQVVHVHEPSRTSEFTRAAAIEGEGFVEYYGAPLVARGHLLGVLEVFHRAPHQASEEWRTFLETLAGQAAIAVDNAQLFQDLQRSNRELSQAYDATIAGWSSALDLRDKETEGHTQRVTELTERLARAAGIPEAELVDVRRGSLLHDIGKLGVPDAILHKPGPLNEDEWKVMRRHPLLAFEMLAPITFLRQALDIPYCHHERWDGTGYPRGLKGEQIPLAARLFAVVDAWDALTSDRPYRPAWSRAKVIKHIRALAGTQFDPNAVDIFIRVIAEKTNER